MTWRDELKHKDLINPWNQEVYKIRTANVLREFKKHMGSRVHGFMGPWVHGCMGKSIHRAHGMGSWVHVSTGSLVHRYTGSWILDFTSSRMHGFRGSLVHDLMPRWPLQYWLPPHILEKMWKMCWCEQLHMGGKVCVNDYKMFAPWVWWTKHTHIQPWPAVRLN